MTGLGFDFAGGMVHTLEVQLSNITNSSLTNSVLLDGAPATVNFSPTTNFVLNLLPAKFQKANGNFVGAKRAACLVVVQLAQSIGCSFLAKLLICTSAAAEATAACAPLGPAAPACGVAAGLICTFIVGKICKLILQAIGLSPQQICNMVGIPEPPC